MSKFWTSWLCVGFLLASSPLFAHARFKLNAAFKSRDRSAGLKTGPCGGIPRTDNPTILRAGQMVEVEWEETINHPGFYQILFSLENDENFVQLGEDVPDDQNDPATIPHSFSTMIQVMTDRNPPVPYFSCADIEIRAADDPTVTPPVAPNGLNIELIRP